MAKIPPEIITEILYRLPAKSLGRFRCVSKGFLSLISQPQFIKTHQNTLNRTHFILQIDCTSLFSLPFNYNELTQLTPTELSINTSNPHRPEIDMFTFHASCNGLILVSGHDVDGGHTLIVVNPATSELLEVPATDYDFSEIDIVFGFGYDSVTDDFKVVTVSFLHEEDIPPDGVSIHVYSLKTNTWRLVSDFPYDHTQGKCCCSGVFVNGFLHWIAIDQHADSDDPDFDDSGSDLSYVIVAFSLADERLVEVPLPESCGDVDVMTENEPRLLISGEKLGVFIGGELWLMNEYGVRASWTKIVIDGFKEDSLDEQVIFCENGKILVVTEKQVLMHDVEGGRLCRRLDTKEFKVVGTFVESLVSLKLT